MTTARSDGDNQGLTTSIRNFIRKQTAESEKMIAEIFPGLENISPDDLSTFTRLSASRLDQLLSLTTGWAELERRSWLTKEQATESISISTLENMVILKLAERSEDAKGCERYRSIARKPDELQKVFSKIIKQLSESEGFPFDSNIKWDIINVFRRHCKNGWLSGGTLMWSLSPNSLFTDRQSKSFYSVLKTMVEEGKLTKHCMTNSNPETTAENKLAHELYSLSEEMRT